MSLASKIRILRLAHGMTVYDLAKKVGKSAGYISKIENGEIPSPEVIYKLSQVFDLPREGLAELAVQEKVERARQEYRWNYAIAKLSEASNDS
jgi:transcriptional regulator with XRE-family HTH domain